MGRCLVCNSEVAEGASFCPRCGARLKAQRTVNAVVLDLIDQYQQQVSRHPNDANARYNLALAYLKARQLGAAVQQLEVVRQLEPDFVDALYLLVLCYVRLNNIPAAKQVLDEMKRAAPDESSTQCAEQIVKAKVK